MKKKIVCLFICVTIIEMLVGDWREGERRSGGRREPPSSPGCPTPSSNHRQTSTNKTHRLNNNNKQSPGGESGSPTAKVVRSKWVEEPDYENIRYHFSALKKFPSLLSDIQWGSSSRPRHSKICNVKKFSCEMLSFDSEFDCMALQCQFCMHIGFTENAPVTMQIWDKIGKSTIFPFFLTLSRVMNAR